MVFSKALLAKGLGGLAMVGTGSLGIISTKVYLDNKLTRFDQGLIDFLNTNEADIQFSVKNESSDITDSFPNFTGSGTEKTATISIKVSINSEGSSSEGTLTEKTGSDKGTKTYLKKLNGGDSAVDWTWICELKFKKEGNSGTELKDKTTLLNNTEPKGFFDKLKEKKPENKALKLAFIRNCAGERGFKKNWEISGASSLTNNEIKSTKEFKLKVGTETKLEFENQSEFENWFNNPKASA